MSPKVSVCIPAYKSRERLRKALQSCFLQSFTDFEIIVTDDSQKGYLDEVVQEFSSDRRLRYFHNPFPLGSPENWNEAQKLASGVYIKMLHHDDWFTTPESLGNFVRLLDDHPHANFAFSGSINCDAKGNPSWAHSLTPKQARGLRTNASILFEGNIIGAPSSTIYRKLSSLNYDAKLKWLVDIELYARVLKKNPVFAYTTDLLVGVTTGSAEQVTAISQNNMMVEISEQVYVFNKFRELYAVDVYCTFQLWRLCLHYRVFNKQKMIECGVAESEIGNDLIAFLLINRLNAKMIHLLYLAQKALSPKTWTNVSMRRFAVIALKLINGSRT